MEGNAVTVFDHYAAALHYNTGYFQRSFHSNLDNLPALRRLFNSFFLFKIFINQHALVALDSVGLKSVI
jgi:hypothetical protein